MFPVFADVLPTFLGAFPGVFNVFWGFSRCVFDVFNVSPAVYPWRPACSPFLLPPWSFSSCHRLFVCCCSPHLPLWQRWFLTPTHCDTHLTTHTHTHSLLALQSSSCLLLIRAHLQHVNTPSDSWFSFSFRFVTVTKLQPHSMWCSRFHMTSERSELKSANVWKIRH